MKTKSYTSIVTLFFLLQVSFPSVAQKFNTSLSATYLNAPFGNLYASGNELISFEETDKKMQLAYTMKLSKAKFGIKLLKYDAAYKSLIKETQLFNGERLCGPFSTSIQKINDKLWLFYSVYEEGSKNVINLMGAKIDPASLTIGEPKQLLQIDQDNTGLFKSMNLMERMVFYTSESPDKSKLLVFWSSNMNNQFFMSVLSSDLDQLWSRKETATSLNAANVNSACVDNNGNVYVGYRYSAEKNEYIGRVTVYQQRGKPKNIDINTTNGFVHKVSVVPAKKADVVYMAGTYARETDRLIGAFSQTITTSNLKPGKLIAKEFPTELVELTAKDAWASTKSKKYGLEPITMQPYELEDGSIALVGQFRSFTSTEKHSYNISGGIVNIRLAESEAQFSWIPKYRVSAGYSIGDAYYAFPHKNKLLIFYNDEADNLKKAIGEKYSTSNNYKNVVLAVASMDDEGKLSREKLIDMASENYLPVGESITPISSASLSVPILKIKGAGGIGAESKTGVINIE